MRTSPHTQLYVTRLTVRRLHVDLSKGFPRFWNGNDAFRTNFANALSMSFPVGEQFFIDSVRSGLKHLPLTPDNDSLRDGLKKFIGQEATHRQLHGIYNTQLEKQGYRNTWELRALKRLAATRQRLQRENDAQPHLHELAITCAVEHLTAILGDVTLSRLGQTSNWFFNAQEPMATLWHWHAAEESEHKSMAFDLYTRLGGGYDMRMYWYRRFLAIFALDLTLQILNNLWRDGSWKRWSTWISAAGFVWGCNGLLRSTWPLLKDYCRKDFHPQQQGNDQLAQNWLKANQVHWSAVS